MEFDKQKYWERRNNTVKTTDKNGNEIEKRQPLRYEDGEPIKAQVPSKAPIVFTNDGEMVVNNRTYRRQRGSLFKKTKQLRKKKDRK